MNKPYCRMPWHAIYIEPNGVIRNCCIAHTDLGTIKDNVDEIMSIGNVPIKRAMNDHLEIDNCTQCHQNKGHRLLDYFDESMDTWGIPLKDYVDNDPSELYYLDIRWKNTCTAACVYCAPTFSSAWARELGEPLDSKKDEFANIKKWLEPKLKDLKRIYLAGGEPLLIKDNEWLLEKLLEVNPNCELLINTNLQTLDTPIYRLVTKFKNVQWLISGENTGARYEFVRTHSSWETFVNNLRTLRKNWNSFSFNIVYHILNVDDVFDYVNFIVSEGFPPESISAVPVSGGDLDVRNLPNQKLQKVIEKTELFVANNPKFEFTFNNILNTLKGNTDNFSIDKTHKFLYNLDNRRNTNSQELWPELWNK